MNEGKSFEDAVLGDFEKYYGSGEVSRIFGVHPMTIDRWRRENRLPAMRTPGGRWRYAHTDVQRLWEEMRNAT